MRDVDIIKFTTNIKNITTNLNLNNPEEINIYNNSLESFIKMHEGIRYEAYDDSTGKQLSIHGKTSHGRTTIGVGFNMDSNNAKKEWVEIFGKCPSFNDTYSGKIRLTKNEAEALFRHNLKIRKLEISKIFENYWNKFLPNQKIATMSMYYNNPNLIRKGTNFFNNMVKYLDTTDENYIKAVIHEILYKSNKSRNIGIQLRRRSEAELFSPNT